MKPQERTNDDPDIKMAAISSGDIRSMAGNKGFQNWAKQKKIDIDAIPTGEAMFEMYMKFLKEQGQ